LINRSNPQDQQDPAQSLRSGRQRGCWIYVTQEALAKAFNGKPPEAAPKYRVQGWGFRRCIVVFEKPV
jgi:hypothetical protein